MNPTESPARNGASLQTGQHSYWFARHAKPLIFLILTLAALGAYLALNIPVSVFPTTNFPRIVLAVDNGVMPIDQMTVTLTRPIEEAVNSVPGLEEVRSVTSRASAEIDLFFDWDVDMFQTLQYVSAAISRAMSIGWFDSNACCHLFSMDCVTSTIMPSNCSIRV